VNLNTTGVVICTCIHGSCLCRQAARAPTMRPWENNHHPMSKQSADFFGACPSSHRLTRRAPLQRERCTFEEKGDKCVLRACIATLTPCIVVLEYRRHRLATGRRAAMTTGLCRSAAVGLALHMGTLGLGAHLQPSSITGVCSIFFSCKVSTRSCREPRLLVCMAISPSRQADQMRRLA
jgi:hypothetical protein